MCCGKEKKWARALERAPGRTWKWGSPELVWAVLSLKMRGSETFWAWKCYSPELPGRVWCWRSGRLLTHDATERFVFGKLYSPERQNLPKFFFNVDAPERILKMMVSGMAKIRPKYVKWWCSGTDLGEICENYMPRNGNSGLTRAENGGLSRGTYPICICMEVPPPGGGGGGGLPHIMVLGTCHR